MLDLDLDLMNETALVNSLRLKNVSFHLPDRLLVDIQKYWPGDFLQIESTCLSGSGFIFTVSCS